MEGNRSIPIHVLVHRYIRNMVVRNQYVGDGETSDKMTEGKSMDRRRDGWTWAKEILGTCIGVATVMSLPTAWLFKSITDIQRSTELHELRIKQLETSMVEGKKGDEKVQDQLSKIYDLVQDVRVQQARQAPR